MTRQLLAFGCAVALVVSAAGQESKSGRPKAKPEPGLSEAAKRLVEEVELLEAQLHTKKAYIQAAQVAVKAAEYDFDRANRAAVVGKQVPVDPHKMAVDAAKAQLAIREAEANEVAVKLKHAKRRAEEAQKAEAAQEGRMRAACEANVQNAKAELDLAEKELARLEELVKRGIVAQVEIDRAREKRRNAAFMVQQFEKELAELGK